MFASLFQNDKCSKKTLKLEYYVNSESQKSEKKKRKVRVLVFLGKIWREITLSSISACNTNIKHKRRR